MSFVASIIYAALVILAITLVFAAFARVFTPQSHFEDDVSSFSNWIETASTDPYVLQLRKGEGFVLGYYDNECQDTFHRYESSCDPDTLCFCLAEKEESGRQLSRSLCTPVPYSVRLVAEDGLVTHGVGPDCISSTDKNWIGREKKSDEPGFYTFNLDTENSPVTLTVSKDLSEGEGGE